MMIHTNKAKIKVPDQLVETEIYSMSKFYVPSA